MPLHLDAGLGHAQHHEMHAGVSCCVAQAVGAVRCVCVGAAPVAWWGVLTWRVGEGLRLLHHHCVCGDTAWNGLSCFCSFPVYLNAREHSRRGSVHVGKDELAQQELSKSSNVLLICVEAGVAGLHVMSG